ncbi:MAG: hypothetical protein M1570_18615 [Chloroflexi bacterium]|nr:hypothetical protein [Chloroflexota bacterium]
MHQIVDFSHSRLGVKLYPGQAEALSGYYESGKPNLLLLAGRRGGKSLMADVVACFEAVVPDFSGMIRPGEERYILIVSVRGDNARLHIRNIAKMLGHAKALGNLIAGEKQDRLELRNNVTILSLPCSARAGRGFTASTLILDELAHYVDSEGNASADVVFDAFTPTLATFGDKGRCVITTTPAAKAGIVFELHDRIGAGELTDFYSVKKTSQELNPAIKDAVIKRAFARDAESAATEYLAEFREQTEAFLSWEAIERCIDRTRSRVESGESQYRYCMAIDPATMGDRYAFTVCHREANKVILDYGHILPAPVDPNAAEDLLFDLVRRFHPTKVFCDTASTVERLKSRLYQLEYTPFTRPLKLRIYGALKESLNLGRLSLYPDANLIDELKALQIRNGVDISAPKAGRVKHDDLSDCLALCVDHLAGQREGSIILFEV